MSRRYDVHIITKDGECKIVPTLSPGNITKLCIGYLRAAVPNSNGNQIFYTGNPCHRTWVILNQSQSQTQTSQGIKVNILNYPIVDPIVCFNIQNGKLINDNIDSDFEVLLSNINFQIYNSSGNIVSEDCKEDELRKVLKNSFQNLLLDNEISKLLRNMPSKIYVVK